jgi:hypothetical protein
MIVTRLANLDVRVLQSFDNIIAVEVRGPYGKRIALDRAHWFDSPTIGHYRSVFLDENIRETQARVDSGDYPLYDLNDDALNWDQLVLRLSEHRWVQGMTQLELEL